MSIEQAISIFVLTCAGAVALVVVFTIVVLAWLLWVDESHVQEMRARREGRK